MKPVLGWDTPVAGMTWGWTGKRGTWMTPEADHSLGELAALGGNWVTLAYAMEQPTAHSLQINSSETVTEEEISHAVRCAHSLGLSVCLKPTVNCKDGTWRAYIDFLFPDVPGEPTWGAWFDAYSEILIESAKLASALDVEMLCVGCEMVSADIHEDHWRRLIGRVRSVYSGLVTYNCDKYQEDRLSWWDAVDVISSSGYYPTGAWQQNLDRIEKVVTRENKPFCFLEAGCPSRSGSPSRPNDWSLPGTPDEAAQASYLEEAFTAMSGRDWVGGVMLWDWPPRLYPSTDGPINDDYCVYAKAGESVVRKYFAKWLTPDSP